jgi:ribosomal protein S27AE
MKAYTAVNLAEFNILQARSQLAARYAVETGKIVKPAHCAKCGRGDIEMHHADYSKPLDVEWLCTYHHKEAGAAIYNEARENLDDRRTLPGFKGTPRWMLTKHFDRMPVKARK